MNEAVQFYSGVLRTNAEAIGLVCKTLDEDTAQVVAQALRDGHRLVLLADPCTMVVALLNMRTGRIGPLLASMDGRTWQEKIFSLTNEEIHSCRGARDAMTPGVAVARWPRAVALRDADPVHNDRNVPAK